MSGTYYAQIDDVLKESIKEIPCDSLIGDLVNASILYKVAKSKPPNQNQINVTAVNSNLPADKASCFGLDGSSQRSAVAKCTFYFLTAKTVPLVSKC